MLYILLSIMGLTGLIFFGTLFMKPKEKNTNEMWTKVRLSTNGTQRDGWCRVVTGEGVTYYGIDGNPIENESVNVLFSWKTHEKPPLINEEDSFVHIFDCDLLPGIDHPLRRAS